MHRFVLPVQEIASTRGDQMTDFVCGEFLFMNSNKSQRQDCGNTRAFLPRGGLWIYPHLSGNRFGVNVRMRLFDSIYVQREKAEFTPVVFVDYLIECAGAELGLCRVLLMSGQMGCIEHFYLTRDHNDEATERA